MDFASAVNSFNTERLAAQQSNFWRRHIALDSLASQLPCSGGFERYCIRAEIEFILGSLYPDAYVFDSLHFTLVFDASRFNALTEAEKLAYLALQTDSTRP